MKPLVLAALLFLVLLPASLFAEPSPSIGVPLPDTSISTQSDAASLEVNPAGLNFIDGANFSYGFFLPTGDYSLVVPSGHALAMGFGGEMGGIGLGVQWMDNPLLGTERRLFQKYSLGGALGSREFSFGATLNSFSSRSDFRLNDLRTIDMGIQWRPGRYFGFGLMARDIRPAFLDEEEALPLRLSAGFALRLFEGRLVIDSEFQTIGGGELFTYQPRLSVEPISGLRLFANGLIDIPMPWASSNTTVEFDGYTFGAELSFGSLGFEGALFQESQGIDDELAMTGSSYRVWAGTPQKRALLQPRPRWVRVNIDASITEQAASQFFGPSSKPFLELINTLDAIGEDRAVSGVILEIGAVNLGYAQLWELHQAMDRLHESGKESLAILKIPSTRTVYAASAAQEIWMAPNLPYGPTGLLVEFTSFAGLFDNLGIEAEFLRIGDYKSAPESYVETTPSEPAREQTGEYLDGIYSELLNRIAKQRGVDLEVIAHAFDQTPMLPAEALEMGLIDAIFYPDELDDLLEDRLGPFTGSEYTRREVIDQRWGARPEIALVYIDGTIIDGESGGSPFGGSALTGADTIRRTLRALAEDRSVKAVVLRVDSPGGSALGSDLIYRELRNLAGVKPVVATMGNVAASGGYYVAAGADEIFAAPTTLTGSIGIFTGKLNVQSLAGRIGVTTLEDRRGERAGAFSLWRPWTESEVEGVSKILDYFYQLFLQQVARTRPLTPEGVDAVGRGRVWTGLAAKEVGLVDEIGGITDAIRRAEELAGLAPGKAVYVDRTGAGGRQLSPGIATAATDLLQRLTPPSFRTLSPPRGALPAALQEMEAALIWPLYFRSDEPLFLLPYSVTIR